MSRKEKKSIIEETEINISLNLPGKLCLDIGQQQRIEYKYKRNRLYEERGGSRFKRENLTWDLTHFFGFALLSSHNRSWLDTEPWMICHSQLNTGMLMSWHGSVVTNAWARCHISYYRVTDTPKNIYSPLDTACPHSLFFKCSGLDMSNVSLDVEQFLHL